MSETPIQQDKPKNKAIIYWDDLSYTVVDSSELDNLPETVQRMIVDSLLEKLGIEMRTR